MRIRLTIKSKNENSLNVFLKIFEKIANKTNLNFTDNRKSIKRFTFLKSPHVNKTAQEHFNFIVFSKDICIKDFQIFKTLIILKKIKNNLCCDVMIKIKFSILKEEKRSFSETTKNFKGPKFRIKRREDKLKIHLLNHNFYGKFSCV